MTKTYTTSDSITFPGGHTYSHICHAGVAEFTIGIDAQQRPGRDGTTCWNWTEKTPEGTTVNMQAYGDDAAPGKTVVRAIEIREKKLAKNKGGYEFLFVKLTETDEPVDSQLVVAGGAYLRKVEDLGNQAITTIWCPQVKHDGGIVFASLHTPLPAQRPTSHQVQRNKTASA